MKKHLLSIIATFVITIATSAQQMQNKPYNEEIDPIAQIDSALVVAKQNNKYVMCQLGGNWCRWCIMFNNFVKNDSTINNVIDQNYVFIHVNYTRNREQSKKVAERLGRADRFGFPVLVLLRQDGSVLHIQDSALLEEGNGYNHKKVLTFLNRWTPKAVEGEKD